MIEMQDKSSRLVPQLHSTGSVPVVMPHMLASHVDAASGLTPSTLAYDIASLLLIVVAPTAFWCAVLCGVRSLLGWDTSSAALTCVALLIGGFLLIIRASLAMDRSA
jgi:hypothetical protein